MSTTMTRKMMSEDGNPKDLASFMSPLQKMSDGRRRRDTADDDEEEADRLMAELMKGASALRAVKVEHDDEVEDDSDLSERDESDEDEEADSKLLIQKKATANVSAQFDCKLCRRTFQNGTGLKRHMNALHPNGQVLRFQCGKCGKGFAKRHHMRNHEATHGPPSARCDLCPATFASKETLVIHKARDHKMTMDNRPVSTAFPCSTCQQAFETQLQLRNHSYVCRRNLANKELKRADKLMRSPKREPKAKVPVTPCEECGKPFSSQCGKTRHIRKHHPKFAEQIDADKDAWRQSLSHGCELCGKRFKQHVELKYHYMRHAGALPFKCDQCDSAYPLASELNKHKARKHSNSDGQGSGTAGEEDGSATTLDDDLAVFY